MQRKSEFALDLNKKNLPKGNMFIQTQLDPFNSRTEYGNNATIQNGTNSHQNQE